MKKYDLAFGMGVGCGVSMSLRDAGVQYLSLPFDWIGCANSVNLAKILAGRFQDWMRLEDLEVMGVRQASQSLNYILRNRSNGLDSVHDFSASTSLAAQYAQVAEKLRRRTRRLDEVLSHAKTAVAVQVENPQRPGSVSDDDLKQAWSIVSAAYPDVKFDWVCFCHVNGVKASRVRSVTDNIIRVECEYQIVENGIVSHTYDHNPLIAWLHDNIQVDDMRTEDEKRKFAELSKQKKANRFGDGNAVSRMINRWQFRLYKRLQKALARKGVIPGERAMAL